ncbi:MAG: OmpL47-type beta-barrel domain-containing protein [Alkalispirochaetaceae bacterium]
MNRVITALLLLVSLTLPVLSQEKRIYTDNGTAYAPPEAQFVLTPEESSEELSHLEYRIGEGAYQRYEGAIQIEEEGRHEIVYRAVATSGTPSQESVYEVVIDATAPRLAARARGAAVIEDDGSAVISSETAVHLEAEDALSGVWDIFVSLDNREFTRYTGPLFFEEEGEYLGYAYVVDNVGNRSETFQATARVDLTPPALSLVPSRPLRTFGGERYSEQGNEIVLSASDRLSGVELIEVSLNEGPFRPYDGPIELTQPGFYTIRGRATDQVGNRSRSQELRFYVSEDL